MAPKLWFFIKKRLQKHEWAPENERTNSFQKTRQVMGEQKENFQKFSFINEFDPREKHGTQVLL